MKYINATFTKKQDLLRQLEQSYTYNPKWKLYSCSCVSSPMRKKKGQAKKTSHFETSSYFD